MDNIDCQCLEVRVCRNENVFSMNRNVMLIWKRGKKTSDIEPRKRERQLKKRRRKKRQIVRNLQ